MTNVSSPIAISLNFDSLSEAYGFPASYRDPSFFEGFDRLADLAAENQFPLSIYVIGKDLDNPEHASRVKYWASQGHEIGNHSFSHYFDLGSMPKMVIRDEVLRAHDRISSVVGVEPKGFISPAWSTSQALISTLIEKNYVYDTSTFPSLFLYPMVAKIALNHISNFKKGIRILRRHDWQIPFMSPTKPFLVDKRGKQTSSQQQSLCVLPLPTLGRMQPCIWHTIGFFLGWNFAHKKTKRLLKEHPGFYYLIHPADFLGSEDLEENFADNLARLDQPIHTKIGLLRDAFSILKDSGRPVVTMLQLALFNKNIISNNPRL